MTRWHAGEKLMGLRELKRGTVDGACICCGEPAVMKSTNPDAVRQREARGSGHHQLTCGDEVCKRAYHRFFKRDERSKP